MLNFGEEYRVETTTLVSEYIANYSQRRKKKKVVKIITKQCPQVLHFRLTVRRTKLRSFNRFEQTEAK